MHLDACVGGVWPTALGVCVCRAGDGAGRADGSVRCVHLRDRTHALTATDQPERSAALRRGPSRTHRPCWEKVGVLYAVRRGQPRALCPSGGGANIYIMR